jgi:hypothetical protein
VVLDGARHHPGGAQVVPGRVEARGIGPRVLRAYVSHLALRWTSWHRPRRDAALVVEVGVSTPWTDRTVKLSAYAAGAIDEVWLVVPDAGLLSCHRSTRP